MKRAIINQLGQLSEQLKAYVGALNYRYLNLCVKAEEVSLLPIQVPIEDEFKNLEDVAYAGKRTGDDYSLYIVPKIQDDMRDIQQAVMKFHPEFIQEDVLKQGANTFYDMCKADMEKARMEADMQFAALGIDEKPEDMDKVKKGVDETCDMWTKKRDQLHDEKLKEIEDAHIKWQTDQQASAQKKQEEDAAHNEDVGSSMRMNSEDE